MTQRTQNPVKFNRLQPLISLMPDRSPIRFVLLMLFAMSLWGFSWTNAKIVGQYTSVPIIIFWRFLIGWLAMIPILYSLRVPILPKKDSIRFILTGGFFIICYNLFFLFGTRTGLAGAGGILVTTLNPLFTFLYSFLFFRILIQKKDILGLILGFIGGSIMLKVWQITGDDLLKSGNAYFLLASSTWAFVTITSSRSKDVIHPLTFSFWIYLVASIITLPAIFLAPVVEVFSFDMTFWMHMTFLSIGALAVGTSIFFIGATHLGSGKASAFIFTVPVTAMGFSMLFLGEQLTLNVAVGGLFTMTAVYLITVHRSSPPDRPSDDHRPAASPDLLENNPPGQ